MKHIRTLYKKLYSLELSSVFVIASPTTPTKAVAFLIYLLVINNMTDREWFGAKTFINFEKIFEVPILSKIDFLTVAFWWFLSRFGDIFE